MNDDTYTKRQTVSLCILLATLVTIGREVVAFCWSTKQLPLTVVLEACKGDLIDNLAGVLIHTVLTIVLVGLVSLLTVIFIQVVVHKTR